MDKTWLVKLYEDVGLPADQADKVAEETRVRMLRREKPRGEGAYKRSLIDFLVRDPLVSMNRIIGRGDVGLPFYDEEMGSLSVVAFSNVMTDVGIDPVVALAYAKVVVEAYEPKDLYGPVWSALGRSGPLDLDELRRMDWSPLRADVPAKATDVSATAVTAVVAAEPKAGTPQAAQRLPTRPGQPARKPPIQPQPKPKK